MMKLGVFVSMMSVGLAAFADPSITEVTAVQRYPWNGKVDISYTVSGDIATKAKEEGLITSLKVSAIDQTTSTTNIATTLSGDLSLADGTHKIVWDMNAQGLTFKSTNVVFNVSCEEKQALYCVIDLSVGTTATSYPVSYLADVPSGGWTTEHKTTKLVLRRIEPGKCVVTVNKAYYIGVFEVTQKQYKLVTGENPTYSGYWRADVAPVCGASWNTIQGGFIAILQEKIGLAFDLPTDAQWEYACRAGTTTTYSYGNNANGDYMWYGTNSGSTFHEVGTCKSNPWGLYDMHGNVPEYCCDWYGGSSSYRVLRNGSWQSDAIDCTSSKRTAVAPSTAYAGYGFRLSRTIK